MLLERREKQCKLKNIKDSTDISGVLVVAAHLILNALNATLLSCCQKKKCTDNHGGNSGLKEIVENYFEIHFLTKQLFFVQYRVPKHLINNLYLHY